MISAQCDRLRAIADDLSGMDYDNYASDVRDAADTIWELRNKMCDMVDARERARVLEAENAKLSTQLTDVTESMGRVEERCAKLRAERDEWHRVAVSKQDIIDHMRDARAENAKLREYAESYAKAVECEGCGWCPYDIDAICGTETIPMRDECKLYNELRELGIEEDE